MEREQALVILKALADGVDPFTGTRLPTASPYQHPDAVRALVVAVEALRSPTSAADIRSQDSGKPRRVIRPETPRVGKPWTPAEEKRLRDAFLRRRSINEIAREHGRTRGGVTSRLIRMGLIRLDAGQPVNSADAGPGASRSPDGRNDVALTDDSIPF